MTSQPPDASAVTDPSPQVAATAPDRSGRLLTAVLAVALLAGTGFWTYNDAAIASYRAQQASHAAKVALAFADDTPAAAEMVVSDWDDPQFPLDARPHAGGIVIVSTRGWITRCVFVAAPADGEVSSVALDDCPGAEGAR